MACSWAEEQERVILRDGVALTESQIADAKDIGVSQPERVRLRVVDKIPVPLHPVLKKAAEKTGFLSPDTIGLTLRYGIYIRSDRWGDRPLVVHELAHTAQYERLGGFDTSLRIAADYDCMLRFLTRGVRVAYLPETLVRMRVGGASNRSLKNILRKSAEDYQVMRRHGVGGVGALMWKNLSKVPQFFRR